MLTIKRPVKILVASHKELRDVDNNNTEGVAKTADELKVRGWKSWLKKGNSSSALASNKIKAKSRNSLDDDDSDSTDTPDQVEVGK